MRVSSVEPIPPAMQMKYSTKVRYDSKTAKRVIDNITLDNGKHLRVTKGYEWGDYVYKLQYLVDGAGNWVRSRLRYYKGRQVIRELNSCNEERKGISSNTSR